MEKFEVLSIVKDLLLGKNERENVMVASFVDGVAYKGYKKENIDDEEEDEEFVKRVIYYKNVEKEGDLLFIGISSWMEFVPEIKDLVNKELYPLTVSSGVCVRYSLFLDTLMILDKWKDYLMLTVVKDVKCFRLIVSNKVTVGFSKWKESTRAEADVVRRLL